MSHIKYSQTIFPHFILVTPLMILLMASGNHIVLAQILLEVGLAVLGFQGLALPFCMLSISEPRY